MLSGGRDGGEEEGPCCVIPGGNGPGGGQNFALFFLLSRPVFQFFRSFQVFSWICVGGLGVLLSQNGAQHTFGVLWTSAKKMASTTIFFVKSRKPSYFFKCYFLKISKYVLKMSNLISLFEYFST